MTDAAIGSSGRETLDSDRRESGDAGIRIDDLTVRIGERTLLEQAKAVFPKGGVTLLVGASGSGKTVLMKILAGLIDTDSDAAGAEHGFRVQGSVQIDGHERLGSRADRSDVGIVFQNFALFDELSAKDNIRFAVDHRRHEPSDEERLTPEALLDELGVPAATPVRSLSGGQQQRLAVARTLAFDPPVIVYDEPTSGLDPVNAEKVASRIRETCDRHDKTTVVVTHDYEHLGDIADRIYVLDPERRALTEIEKPALGSLSTELPGARVFDHGAAPPAERPLTRIAKKAVKFFERSGAVLEQTGTSLAALFPFWRSPRWGLRYFLHFLRLVASPSAWVYFGTAGAIAGFVATYFSYEFLPHRSYTEPLIGDEILNAVGFALYRIVVPVLVTVLLAARCGAAVASDVANRSYGHQADAMRSLGAHPRRYLLTNVLWAFLIAAPLLVLFGFLVSRITSLAVFVFHHPKLETTVFWERHFSTDLAEPGALFYDGSGWLLAKVLACAFGIAAVAFFQGIRPMRSGVEVSRAITNTVIWGTLLVLLVHFGFAFVEFDSGPS